MKHSESWESRDRVLPVVVRPPDSFGTNMEIVVSVCITPAPGIRSPGYRETMNEVRESVRATALGRGIILEDSVILTSELEDDGSMVFTGRSSGAYADA